MRTKRIPPGRRETVSAVLRRATALGVYPETFDVGKPTQDQKRARRWLGWWLHTQGLTSGEVSIVLGVSRRQAWHFFLTESLVRRLARAA